MLTPVLHGRKAIKLGEGASDCCIRFPWQYQSRGSGLSPGGRFHDHSAQPGCIQSRFELYAGGKAASYTRQQFVSTPEHYSALFHEQKDGIGHEKRLYRRAVKAHFGIQECSKEEFLWPRSAPLLWFTRPGSLRVEQEKQPRQGLILNRNCEILTLR